MATDNVGRNIDAGMDSSQLKGLIQSLAKSDVGKPKPFKQTASSNEDKILSELKSFAPKFSNSIKKFEGLVESVKKFVSANSGKDAKQSRFGKNAEAADKAMKKLADKGLKKGSIWTHDMYVEKMQKLMYLEMRKQTAVLQNDVAAIRDLEVRINAGRTELDNAAVRESSPSSRFDLKNIGGDTNILALAEIGKYVDDFTDSIGDFQKTIYGFRATEVLFKDLYAAERDFTINTRQIAFEIAGATKESRGLQRSFEDIGRTSAETGFDRSTVQEAYLKALKKGTKEQKTALSITKNQLNTERMIGVSAGTLEDTFTNMSLQMGMNNSQMAQFGRGVQDVAKNTGVTGEHLANAVRSSEGIMKNMRNIGTLNAQAASNVVGLLASAEKFGVGDFAQDLSNTLSQGLSGFIHADSRMQIILGQALGHNAKLFEQMRNGTIMQTKEGMRGLAKGMEDTLAKFSGGRVKTAKDFAKLSDQEKMILNTRMKEATGRTAVEFLQIAKSIDEAAEPLSKKLEKIAEQKKKNLNAEEKATLLEQERSLKVSTGLSALTQLDEELQKTDGGIEGMNKALAKLKTSEMAKELQSIGISAEDPKAIIEQTLLGLNEGLKKVGQSSVDISSDRIQKALSGDTAEREKIMEEMNAGQQKLATAQKDASDPMTQLRRSMEKLNDTLRGTTQGAISTMMNSVFGSALGILTTLVDIGGMTAGFVLASFVQYHGLKASMDKLSKGFSGFSSKIPKFGEILKTTDKLGDSLRSNILDSLDIFGKKISKFFSGIKNGFKDSWSIFSKGFSRSRQAGTGFFKSLVRGFSGLTKSNSITRGVLSAFTDNVFVKGFSKSRKAGAGFFKSLGKGFSYLAKSNDVTRGILVNVTEGFSKYKGAYSKVFANGFTGIFSKLFSGGKGLLSAIRGGGFLGAIGGVGKLFSGGLRVGLKGAMMGLRATLIGSTAGLAQIAFSAIDGIFGAFRGFQKTGERFSGVLSAMGKSTEDLTWGMYASSTIAGALVGILDGLTFGLLRMSGVAEWLESWISLLSYTVFSFWEGVLDGLMIVVNMVKPSLKYLYDQFASLGASLLSVFNSITSLFGLQESKSLAQAFAILYDYIFKPLGFVLGTLIGGSLGTVLWVAIKSISAFIMVIQVIVGVVAGAINIFLGFFKFFKDIFTVGVGKAFENLGSTIWQAVVGIFSPINSFFANLPFEILKGLASLPSMFINWVAEMFGMMPGAIGKSLYSAASTVGLGWLIDKMMGTSGGVTSTPTESLASASSGPSVTVANTAPLSQEENIQRNSASAEAPVNKELGEIASANSTQVEQMNQMIALLTQMVNQAGGESESFVGSIINGLGGDMDSTMTNSVVTSPPKYYKWSTGKHMQTSALGVSNLANIG